MTLLVFQLDISDKYDKEVHPPNKQNILVTFEISHFEISGNDDNEEQSSNIFSIFVIFLIPVNLISKIS